MRARRHDLVIQAGTTLGLGVRYYTRSASAVPVKSLIEGDMVMGPHGQPWRFSMRTTVPAGFVIHFGWGQPWDPKVRSNDEDSVFRAVPQQIEAFALWMRGPQNRRFPIPAELSADRTVLTVLPHNETSREWTRDLQAAVEGVGQGTVLTSTRTTFDWDLTVRRVGRTAVDRIVEGTLVVIPSVAYDLTPADRGPAIPAGAIP